MKTVILLASLLSVGLQGLASGQIKTELWTTREIADVGLRFKLPKRYTEKRWEVSIPGTPLGRRFYADVTFADFEIEKRTTFDHAKTHFQLDYSDFKEWT